MSGNATSASQPGASPGLTDRLEVARARLGRVVAGRWTLLSVLGVGGSATVYEAAHRNGRRAALKVLHPELASSPSVVRRLLSEGYAANRVQHPGAVLVLDDGEDAGLVFLVMELLEGRSLSERLGQEGPLPVADVVRIWTQVLDVLASAHDRGVIHRDIKPSNVFELRGGSVKVLDFGVAQVREPGAPAITQSGFTVGTPAFMAPEQAGGRLEEIDALTDVWAVGASMYQSLTGKVVHSAASVNAALVAAATTPVKKIRSVRRDLPADVAAVVDRALEFRRENRWPNARAMRQALLKTLPGAPQAADAVAGTETIPEVSLVAAPPRGGRRWFWAAAAAGTCAILLLAWVALFVPAEPAGVEPIGRTETPEPARSAVPLGAPAPTPSSATAASSEPPAASPPPSASAQSSLTSPPRTRATPPSKGDRFEEDILDRRK